MSFFAGKWADYYQKEHYRTPERLPSLLENPQSGLEFFLHNGFARAGGEQAGYGDIAVEALHNCVSSAGTYQALIEKDNTSEIVWVEFERICEKQGKGVNKRVNEGVIKGLIKLSKESFQCNYNPLGYMINEIESSMTDAFLHLRNIKGIGDKIASFLLRDIVCILDAEMKIPQKHRIFLQPIDRWIKGTAIYLWKDINERTPNWVIAQRIVDKCEEFEISGVRFNQGAWQYCVTEVKDVKNLYAKLCNLCEKEKI
jgi:hypothetical protein